MRVVAYREATVRLACESCELRFSVSPGDVATALSRAKWKLVEPVFNDDGVSDDYRGELVGDLYAAKEEAVAIASLSLYRPGQTFQQRSRIEAQVRNAIEGRVRGRSSGDSGG